LTGEYDLSAVADATAARLSELERPLLVGFSSGGYRVLQIALKHPRIVRGVVALAPMIAPCLEAASLLASADAAEAGFDLTEPLVQTMFSPTFRARHEDSCRRIVRELMIGAAPLSVPVAELRAFARAPDLAPALVGLAVPLLVRVGTEDGRVSEAQSAAASAPNGELQLVPDAGHMLHYEDLAGTCDAIGRFDARCTGA
jgi:pimeloyl-ACP methyl ester carboxylesterase